MTKFLFLVLVAAWSARASQSGASEGATDSLEAAQDAWQRDSLSLEHASRSDSSEFECALARLPDTLRAEIRTRRSQVESRVAQLRTLSGTQLKERLDSLAEERSRLREALLAPLPVAEQKAMRERLAAVEARKELLRVRLAADRALLQERIQALRAARAAP